MAAHAATATNVGILLGMPVALAALLAAPLLPPGGVLALAATAILLTAIALAELRRGNPLDPPAPPPSQAE